MHHNVWDEIICPFLNYNGATIEVWIWTSNLIPHFAENVITEIGQIVFCTYNNSPEPSH